MSTSTRPDTQTEIEAFQRGDESAFEAIAERYRPALRVHCYRMLGSFDEAEDLTQETLLRAWSKRESFEGRAKLRSWLYSIATNACLDAKDAIARRPATVAVHTNDGENEATTEITWLQPYPDALLDADPESAAIDRETIELAYIAAIQHLTPKSRAVLILRDVLEWSAKETAELLDTTVASANSSLQRAREAMREHLPPKRAEWPSGADASAAERELAERYLAASENIERDAWVKLLTEDARFSMPPELGIWVGAECMVDAWISGGLGDPDWGEIRIGVTRANRQLAFANYVRKPGDSEFRAFAIDVVRVADGRVSEILAFPANEFSAFGLPPTL
ncbi:MAG: RNA polymerase subunit sigma-70 [Actinobacteria bacterium]|nr:RNA polymerase subunit sigma-70 [Actinomycetota bacterium]